MGLLSDVMKAVDDYGRKHKEHMAQQWEKQAEKAKEAEPKPLTETQRVWLSMREEREQQERQQLRQQQTPQAAPQQQPDMRVTATPLQFTITWKIRMSGLNHLPLPWATN